MAKFRKYNPSNEPGTCLWCGRDLPIHHLTHWVETEPGSPERQRGSYKKKVYTGKTYTGPYNNGFFCTQGCGFQFGVEMARNGQHLVGGRW